MLNLKTHTEKDSMFNTPPVFAVYTSMLTLQWLKGIGGLDAIETINGWFLEGHHICFFTARTEEHREVTEIWLKEKGFNYHSLLMGKPRGGNYHWIDNHVVRATRYTSKFTNLIKRNAEIEVFNEHNNAAILHVFFCK